MPGSSRSSASSALRSCTLASPLSSSAGSASSGPSAPDSNRLRDRSDPSRCRTKRCPSPVPVDRVQAVPAARAVRGRRLPPRALTAKSAAADSSTCPSGCIRATGPREDAAPATRKAPGRSTSRTCRSSTTGTADTATSRCPTFRGRRARATIRSCTRQGRLTTERSMVCTCTRSARPRNLPTRHPLPTRNPSSPLLRPPIRLPIRHSGAGGRLYFEAFPFPVPARVQSLFSPSRTPPAPRRRPARTGPEQPRLHPDDALRPTSSLTATTGETYPPSRSSTRRLASISPSLERDRPAQRRQGTPPTSQPTSASNSGLAVPTTRAKRSSTLEADQLEQGAMASSAGHHPAMSVHPLRQLRRRQGTGPSSARPPTPAGKTMSPVDEERSLLHPPPEE